MYHQGVISSRTTVRAQTIAPRALRCLRGRLLASAAAPVLFLIVSAFPVAAQKPASKKPEPPIPVAEIVTANGEPELRVGGVPFFVHAAQFDYFRIPPDLWIRSLLRYRELGINTIDLRIPWNWHEPSDGKIDFDGTTNPNRNLRGLLGEIAGLRFKVIARPGPLIGDHWRNGGLPAWLLAYSDYDMDPPDIQRGLEPPDAALGAKDSNEEAGVWLENKTHMIYSRRWLTAVAKVLAPFAAKNLVKVSDPGEREGEMQEIEIPGPLLFVALGEGVRIPAGGDTSDFVRYLRELRGALVRGGLDAMIFLDAPGAAKEGLPQLQGATDNEPPLRIGFAGQWFYERRMPELVATKPAPGPPQYLQGSLLNDGEASVLVSLVRSLDAQSGFPPLVSAFSPTAVLPRDEARISEPPPENGYLASRLLLGAGARGIVYLPLQDTLTPAGWESPSAARYYRWDAPLDLSGNRGPRAAGVIRNGQLFGAWGGQLAASHVQSDFGIIDLRGAGVISADAASASYAAGIDRLCRIATLAGYTPSFIHAGAQPMERLQRERAIVLEVPLDNTNGFSLPEAVQKALLEYVRKGGVLIYFPSRPKGAMLDELWQGAPAAHPEANHMEEETFGEGRVIGVFKDFYSPESVSENSAITEGRRENVPDVSLFQEVMERAGAQRALRVTNSRETGPSLIANELVANTPKPAQEPARNCADMQLCAAALVSVTNLDPARSADASLEIKESAGMDRRPDSSKISLDVTVPPRESLLLPVHASLCSAVGPAERCSDEVITAGAELLGADRDGKILELAFYAPARATVRLSLESAPTRIEYEENFHLDFDWKQETGELQVQIPRGAAPAYWRVLRVHLRYTPHVPEKMIQGNDFLRGVEYDVFDSVRFPLGAEAAIPSLPPLLSADTNSGGYLVVSATNHSDDLRSVDFNLDGPFHGSGYTRIPANQQTFTRIRFQPARTPAGALVQTPPGPDGLLQGTLAMRAGRDRLNGPLGFIPQSKDAISTYQYDFDEDGAPEWMLESSRLRLIVSPADSGRAEALVNKSTNQDLITFGGAMHDLVLSADAESEDGGASDEIAFNRAYRAEWTGEKDSPSLRLAFQEHSGSPAGHRIEKTVRFAKPEMLEISYRISRDSGSAAQQDESGEKEMFASEFSVPALATEDARTRFCWQAAEIPPASAESSPDHTSAATPCEEFSSRGDSLTLPPGMSRLVVQNPGSPGVAIEWTSGKVVVIPKSYSAQIRILNDIPDTPDSSAEFTVRYTLMDAN